MNAPRITIVTPSYNQGTYLEDTIQSVLDQRYPNLEYMIIDGGSTDASPAIIRKYADHLAYWVSEKDRGQSHAINKGFRRATGVYLNWLNADDILLDHALETLAEYLETHPDIAVVYGNTEYINSRGEPLFRSRVIPFDRRIMVYAFNDLPQPSALFRKQMLDDIGYLDESLVYCMDHEFWLRADAAGYRFACIRDCLSGYRYHAVSKGMQPSSRARRERLRLKRIYGYPLPPALGMIVYPLLNLAFRTVRKIRMLQRYHATNLYPVTARMRRLEKKGTL